MTLLFNREVAGPATHAFVVGVGNFPHAATGDNPDLVDVPNLPSAADSAKLMCEWLLANRDNLVAPLASLEVLISDPPDAVNRYAWQPGAAIDPATPANVKVSGKSWMAKFPAGSQNIAYFYGCGHGANLAAEPVLFLEDLNLDADNAWPNIHAANLARALRLHPHVDAAYIFIDACGQKVKEFELCPADNRQPTVFYPAVSYGAVGANKVMLTSAAPEGQLAYDAPLTERHFPAQAGVPIGRFTQTLIMALNGSSIRSFGKRWAVNSTGLRDDLKRLKQFYFPHLTDHPFEPTPIYGFNEVRPFVFPQAPTVPFVATTNPNEKIELYEFCIKDVPPPPAPVDAGMKHDPVRKAWFGEMPPRSTSVYAVAFNGEGFFANPFTPDQPKFDLQVDIL